jgi:molybdate transport system substrate-binding protein
MLMRGFPHAIGRAVLEAAVAAFLVVTLSLQAHAQTRDILVFAPENLKNALNKIHGLFLYDNAFNVGATYGSSSELARQIETGAPTDVVISDGPEAMDYLAEHKLIQSDTRADLVGEKLVLVARADSKLTLTIGQNFPLAQALGDGRLAMADPNSVAAGKYGKAALEALGVWASVANKVAQAQNAQEALLLVSRGESPLGIVYQSDAAADKNVKILAAFSDSSHAPILYPIAILTSSTNVLAEIYVQYLLSAKATPFFEEQGFLILH